MLPRLAAVALGLSWLSLGLWNRAARPVGKRVGGPEDPQPGLIPVGGIIVWSGAANAVPLGWNVCDGTMGTPDLRDKFVMGASGAFAVGATGGSASHVHPFTHESAHAITQPVFAAPAAHGITQPVFDAPAAHVITQPVFAGPAAHSTLAGHAAHASLVFSEVTVTALGGGTGLYALSDTPGGVSKTKAFSHDHNHDALDHNHDAPAETTNVALSNNHGTPNRSIDVALSNNHVVGGLTTPVALTNNAPHAGGSVDAATGVNKYPPYYSLCYIMRLA